MKGILRILLVITLSVAFIVIGASFVLAESDSEIQGEDVLDDRPDRMVYDAMVDQFEADRYEDAYENAKELERRKLLNYSNDGNRSVGVYLTYLEGWKAAKEDDIGTALECFEPFVENGFAKSKGYYNYLLGRIEQDNGNYLDALTYYEAALDPECYVDFALPYWRECKKLSNEQAYEEAQEYFDQGNYAAAAEKYEALNNYSDSNEKMKESYYLLGKQKYEKREYGEAYDLFSKLAKYKYKDSKELADAIWQVSQNQDSEAVATNLQCINTDLTSLEIAWDDVQNLNDYDIVYYPLSMADRGKSISVKQKSAMINNLIPGTKYSFTVTSKQSDAFSISGTFETAQIVDTVELYNDTTYIFEFNQRDLKGGSLEKVYGIADKLKQNVLQIGNRKLSDLGIGCMIAPSILNNSFSEEEEIFELMCIYRVGSDYVGSSKLDQQVKKGYMNTTCYVDLTPSLDDIFNYYGEWPTNRINIDIIVNGKRADQAFIDIEKTE